MKKLLKYFVLGTGLIAISTGTALIVWFGLGQFQAQMNYDGQYISWRLLKDISLNGLWGILLLVAGFILFPIGMLMED